MAQIRLCACSNCFWPLRRGPLTRLCASCAAFNWLAVSMMRKRSRFVCFGDRVTVSVQTCTQVFLEAVLEADKPDQVVAQLKQQLPVLRQVPRMRLLARFFHLLVANTASDGPVVVSSLAQRLRRVRGRIQRTSGPFFFFVLSDLCFWLLADSLVQDAAAPVGLV